MMNDPINPSLVSASRLAYLGDCVFELCAREYLVRRSVRQPSVEALHYVTARVQSQAVDKLLPLLTEEEEAQYRRGRNIGHTSAPKSASLSEYRRATGLEALFGWLWLMGRQDRLRELFGLAFQEDTPDLEREQDTDVGEQTEPDSDFEPSDEPEAE